MNTEDREGKRVKVGDEEVAKPRVQRTLKRVLLPTYCREKSPQPWSQPLPNFPADGGCHSLPGGKNEGACICVKALLVHRVPYGWMLCFKHVTWEEFKLSNSCELDKGRSLISR